jgi:hypothetical protein
MVFISDGEENRADIRQEAEENLFGNFSKNTSGREVLTEKMKPQNFF